MNESSCFQIRFSGLYKYNGFSIIILMVWKTFAPAYIRIYKYQTFSYAVWKSR